MARLRPRCGFSAVSVGNKIPTRATLGWGTWPTVGISSVLFGLWHTGYNLPLYLGPSGLTEGAPMDATLVVMAKLAPALVLLAYGLVLLRRRPA